MLQYTQKDDFPADAKVLEVGAVFGTLTGCLGRQIQVGTTTLTKKGHTK